jgi:nucleotide-binding universal stress UspA family protein
MLLGASEKGTASDVIFTPIVDHLVRFSPCPTMVINGGHVAADWQVGRIMVPTNGTMAARHAAEVGFALASNEHVQVHILTVVERDRTSYTAEIHDALQHRQVAIAQHMVDELRVIGDSLEVPTIGEVRIGNTAENVVLEVAQHESIDLIILGIDVRTGTRLYFGPRVEYMLNHAPCPVLVINAAYGRQNSVIAAKAPSSTPVTEQKSGSRHETME